MDIIDWPHLINQGNIIIHTAYQLLDASVLPHNASGSVKFGHVSDGLPSKTLETTIGGLQDLNQNRKTYKK